MGRLDNKVAVVTGGASNPSLGRAMSIAFALEGAKVVLTDIDTEGGKKVEEEILNSGGECSRSIARGVYEAKSLGDMTSWKEKYD